MYIIMYIQYYLIKLIAMGKSTIQFFKDLGSRLAVRFQDQRESDFLFQRVSLAILRGTPSAFCNRTVIRNNIMCGVIR